MVGGLGALVFAPIAQFESWFYESGSTIPAYFRDRNALLSENEELRNELESAGNAQNSLDRLTQENLTLRGLLGNATSSRIAAAVIGRPTAMPYDVLVLDKGRTDGVQVDAPVYAGFDQVVGFVAAVYQNSSVVALPTTPGFESTVYIFGPNIYTTAVGEGGGVLQVSVPQGIPLAEDDLVVIPSFDTGVFGRISVIESHPTEPEQRGYVTLPVSLQSLRFVSVGTSPLTSLSFEEAAEVVRELRQDLSTVPVPSGVLVDTPEDVGTSSATSTATSTATSSGREL